MNKKTIAITAAAIAVPLLTVMVWIIWLFVVPAMKERFLNFTSRHVEKVLYGDAKAKAAKKRLKNSRKPYGKR